MTDDANVKSLIEALRAANGGTRLSIASQLAKQGDAAVRPLKDLLWDTDWTLRYWAARTLGELGSPRAIAALEVLEARETHRSVKGAVFEALVQLGARKLPKMDAKLLLQAAARKNTKALQDETLRLRKRLISEYQSGSPVANRTRNLLIEAHLELIEALANKPLSDEDLAGFREYYTSATEPSVLLRERNTWCWVCTGDVATETNETCTCGWLVCACNACQCPDFSQAIGTRGRQPECQEQIERLGEEHYRQLIAARQERIENWHNYQFARVDFSDAR